jgi:hypothetical protein
MSRRMRSNGGGTAIFGRSSRADRVTQRKLGVNGSTLAAILILTMKVVAMNHHNVAR